MKIIKPGKIPDGTIKFKCAVCGCVFLAEKEECKISELQYKETLFEHDCPCCGAECKDVR